MASDPAPPALPAPPARSVSRRSILKRAAAVSAGAAAMLARGSHDRRCGRHVQLTMTGRVAAARASRLAGGLLAAGLVFQFAVHPAAQPAEPMTAARIRGLTRSAQSSARGDQSELILALDASVRERWGDFESFPLSLVKRDDLTIVLTAPFMAYRRTLAEYLRIGRPPADVPWVAAVVVTVSPAQIGAPDIVRVVVERGGTPVTPLENRLRPMTFSNGRGEEAVIHGGEVHFPLAAFAPGAAVTVAAVPREGTSFTAALSATQLQTLK